MGYVLRAFVGPTADVQHFASFFQHAHRVGLGLGLSLIPLTDDLYDEMNNFVESAVSAPFIFLTHHLEQRILEQIGLASMGYLEAEYFGGHGDQAALLWQVGRRSLGPTTINAVLRTMGVQASREQDEFDTIGLGRYRTTEEWRSA